MIYNSYVTSAQKKRHEPLFRSGMVFVGLDSLEFFGDLIIDTYSSGTEREVMLTDKFENFLSSVDPALDLVKIKM